MTNITKSYKIIHKFTSALCLLKRSIYCNCKDEHKDLTSLLIIEKKNKKQTNLNLTTGRKQKTPRNTYHTKMIIHFHSGGHQPIPNFGSKPSLWVHVRTHNLCFGSIIRKIDIPL